MTTLDLSSSFPSGFLNKYLKDATKSQLGSDPLAESWPMSFMQSAFNSNKETTHSIDKTMATSCSPSPASSPGPEANDLHSLAWLQRDHILDIAPLDDDDNFYKPDDVNRLTFPLEKNNNWPNPSKSAEKVNVAEMLKHMSQIKCATSSPHTYHTHPGSSFPQQDCPTSSSGGRRPPKPAYSYTHLIYMAIESSAHKCRTVNQIYTWCETHFPYFRTAGPGWKNSLRHNLSINKSFKRIPRDGRGPGRGAYWTVVPSERLQLLEAVKRNPWTYRAGLASIPGLLPTLQPHIAAELKKSPGKTATMGYSSASEEPASSRASDTDSDCDSLIEHGTEDDNEDIVYAKILRSLVKEHVKSQKSLYRPCKHSKSSDKENKPSVDANVYPQEVKEEIDVADENDSNCGPLDLSMNSAEFKQLDKKSVTESDKGSSPNQSAEMPPGSFEIIAPEPNHLPIEVKTDFSSENKMSSITESPPCEKCLERRRRSSKCSQPRSKRSHGNTGSSNPIASSSPIKRRARPCYFTPAPHYDHEYAMCQAQLHPPTNFSDDEADMDDGNHTEPMSQPADMEDLEDIPSDSELTLDESFDEKNNRPFDSLNRDKSALLGDSSRSVSNLVKDIDQNFNRRKRLSNPKSYKPIGWTRGTSWQRSKRTKLTTSVIAAK